MFLTNPLRGLYLHPEVRVKLSTKRLERATRKFSDQSTTPNLELRGDLHCKKERTAIPANVFCRIKLDRDFGNGLGRD